MNTTSTGVLNPQATNTIDDAADALLKRWEDAEKPSEDAKETEVKKEPEANAEDQEPEQTDEETNETDDEEEAEDADESEEEEESEEESDDEAQEDEGTPKKVLNDDAEIEVKVGDETKKVPVKDLKRLYGQEAALTKKSQEVATQRKEVEAQGAKHAAVLDQLMQRAKAKWEPYAQVDMLLASKELDTETFAALRAEAQAAHEEYQFISQEASRFMEQAQAQRTAMLAEMAKNAVTVLKEKIPNWSNDYYDKLRAYAVEQGFDPQIASQIADPNAILMMHKARLYDQGKAVKLKAKPKMPTKVIKSSNTQANDLKPTKDNAAMARLKSSGSVEDAVEAMMARWGQ